MTSNANRTSNANKQPTNMSFSTYTSQGTIKRIIYFYCCTPLPEATFKDFFFTD